jgi:hypothetical protein
MTTPSAENDNARMSANLKLLMVDTSLSRNDNSIFLRSIPNHFRIFRTTHSVVADVLNIQRRRTIPERLG